MTKTKWPKLHILFSKDCRAPGWRPCLGHRDSPFTLQYLYFSPVWPPCLWSESLSSVFISVWILLSLMVRQFKDFEFCLGLFKRGVGCPNPARLLQVLNQPSDIVHLCHRSPLRPPSTARRYLWPSLLLFHSFLFSQSRVIPFWGPPLHIKTWQKQLIQKCGSS